VRPGRALVAGHLAVVGGVDDDRVLQQALLRQPVADPADVFVDVADHRPVAAPPIG
jgi:hypothetical protein